MTENVGNPPDGISVHMASGNMNEKQNQRPVGGHGASLSWVQGIRIFNFPGRPVLKLEKFAIFLKILEIFQSDPKSEFLFSVPANETVSDKVKPVL